MYDGRMQIAGFQWDDGNRGKCRKHGVDLEEIEALFSSATLLVFPDPHMSESRLRGVGRTTGGRHVFLVWTLRETPEGLLIRPISARYMHAKEVEHYEQDQR